MKPFDLTTSPFVGTNLIEASAGTGKTYTIAGLFVRLVIERQIPAEQILVVTFTKAATEELKDRIRKKLLQARTAFLQGNSDTDSFIDALVKGHGSPETALRLLQDAIVDFDKVPIFTIHGFCQRVLIENAFETGNLFDTELVTDPTGYTQQVAADFWRKHFYHSPPEFVSFSTRRINGPNYFLNLLNKIKTPDIRILPEVGKPPLTSLAPFRKAFNKLQHAWSVSRDDVVSLLKDPSLSGKVYGSLKIFSLAEAMDRFTGENSTGFPLFKDFEKFTASKLSNSVKKNQSPPSHRIFYICDELYDLGTALESEMEAYLLFLKSEFIRFALPELQQRKRNRNIQFYDDLLVRLMRALDDPGGNELAAAIRQKYRAALIDEFQDTDSVQYAIFSRLFPDEDEVLFLIGDPKQAIYSFRGADIFSYLDAARHADAKFTLTENWRSEPDLITAVNTLFSNVKTPFVFDDIPFEMGKPRSNLSGQAPSSQKGGTFPAEIAPDQRQDVERSMPLTLWYLIPENDSGDKDIEKPINKAEAVQRIARAVSAEISRLIASDCDTSSCGTAAGHIAVLVRTNRQARIIKDHLSVMEIPSVLYSSENIFDSHEAMEIERLLSSISEPVNERRFRAALATDMLGVTGNDLDFSEVFPPWWETRLADFREYFRTWERYGFIRMFQQLLVREGVRKRLLSYPDGERRLTNVLHLSELLHHESIEKKRGVGELLKWLSEQRDPDTPRLEAHQIRLESDRTAVKIVTIHKSKGLEYDIVFCPFGWEGSQVRDEEIVFHDLDAGGTLTLNLDGKRDDNARIDAQNELLAENLRLLYVALTRAKNRCYVVWGRINTAETSALAYLFHSKDHKDRDRVFTLKETFSRIGNSEFLKDLKHITDRSQGTIGLAPLPTEREVPDAAFRPDEKDTLTFRKISKRIDTTWKISSYSALVTGFQSTERPADVELPDRDAYTRHRLYSDLDSPDATDVSGKTDIFSFPRGARAGIFFHDVFEHVEFDFQEQNYLKDLVERKLQEHGFEEKWKETVCTMVQHVLSVSLPAVENGFTLSGLSDHERMNEAEFYFPLNPISPETFKKIFRTMGSDLSGPGFPERLEKLMFSPARGFMKGYIDMIFEYGNRFFIVDWKSNYLGSNMADYTGDALAETMATEFYLLQYHLYTLALHQYLRNHVPDYQYESHFGGVFYIFVRGVNADMGPKRGIYYDLPSWRLIKAMGTSLITGFLKTY